MTLAISSRAAVDTQIGIRVVGESARFVIDDDGGVATSGTCAFSSLSITQFAIVLVVPAGSLFQGNLDLEVHTALPHGEPCLALEAHGLEPITVNYPTLDGPAQRTMADGDTLPLDGYYVPLGG
jgi:hypothetical protein